ncbi:hypothetical protein F4778DRAFT_722478 [Xylariomycetidae sp. FL2044]|nr:hypothetical protein F4778DRAFT_722478 [Xylariomycetidae sp. FL2044]
MRSIVLPLLLSWCTSVYSSSLHPPTTAETSQQVPMALPGSGWRASNNATYGPVPKEDQLFQLEFLEIAPWPIPVNQIFFILLRGDVPGDVDAEDLEHARINMTMQARLADGEELEPATATAPLVSMASRNLNLTIRNASYAHVEALTPGGQNDILVDLAIPGMFVASGYYTFTAEAFLPDRRCLFSY